MQDLYIKNLHSSYFFQTHDTVLLLSVSHVDIQKPKAVVVSLIVQHSLSEQDRSHTAGLGIQNYRAICHCNSWEIFSDIYYHSLPSSWSLLK